MRSKITRRVAYVAAGTVALLLAGAVPARAVSAQPSGPCDPPPYRRSCERAEYPYTSAGDPMGLTGLTSPDQSSEEGTMNRSAAQLDAQVGARPPAVAPATRPAHAGRPGDWVAPAFVLLLAAAAIAMGIRLVFLPLDRIPRIGGPGGSTAG